MRVLSKSVNSLIVCDIVGGISIVGFLAFYYRLNIFVSILAVALFVLCNHFILSAKGYYQIRPYKFRGIGSYLLLEGVVLAALPVLFVLFFLIHPPVLLLKLIASEIVLFYVFVIALRSSFNLFRAYIKPDKRVLILGTGITAQMVAKEIIERPLLKFKLIGFLENDSEKRDFEFRGIKVLGTSSDAIKIVKQNKIDIVITSQVGMFDYQTQYDISECVPLKISFWKMYEFYEEITGKIPVEAISPAWFMFNFGTAHRPFYKFFKRAIDIIAGILILLINSPVLLLVAAWIKIYDRGPVIFKQVRVGFNGRPF